ncbi:MAG: class I SAM-dependent methyltransferase [Acidobacteriota bacterium]|nr:class I SAM-dependent methyltransferase [Acidobacteriota bacterium]
MNSLVTESRALFDKAYSQINDFQIIQGMSELITGLHGIRRRTSANEWSEFAKQGCLNHPIKSLVHQDPMTRRAFEKPRGYAGDAELLDLIYGLRPVPAETTSVGAAIYGFTVQASGTSAVRVRRDMLAAKIDEVADEIENPRILAVACGHLREAQKSKAVAAGRVGDFYALDQDKVSLELVAREQSANGITPVHGSVKTLLKGETTFSNLDFVYSTGLYDYLPQPVAISLTNKLFDMLRPGGRLVVANFLPDVVSLGYMETFMGWPLIYRNDEEMADIAVNLPAGQVAAEQVYHDAHEHVVFLEVKKR